MHLKMDIRRKQANFIKTCQALNGDKKQLLVTDQFLNIKINV